MQENSRGRNQKIKNVIEKREERKTGTPLTSRKGATVFSEAEVRHRGEQRGEKGVTHRLSD